MRDGTLAPGDVLVPLRAAAIACGVSPATVASAYRILRDRGLVAGDRRRGTRVLPQPSFAAGGALETPPGVTDLAVGNPDPALLPSLADGFRRVPDASVNAYATGGTGGEGFRAQMRAMLAKTGLPADAMLVVHGAMDGVERVLSAHLRPGDRVVVEDPCYPAVLDVLRAGRLIPVPMAVDDDGPDPGALEEALQDRAVRAVIVTPRAQNPFGAAIGAVRAGELRAAIARRGDVVVIEDDFAGPVAGVPHHPIVDPERGPWAVACSTSKWLGPDLRVAALVGDPTTAGRVAARFRAGPGWVSHISQHLADEAWRTARSTKLIKQATDTYKRRRKTLIDELARRGIPAHGRTGLNVWVPVPSEQAAASGLLTRGWLVSAGEPYRLACRPGIRVTISRLGEDDAARLAEDFADVLSDRHVRRMG